VRERGLGDAEFIRGVREVAAARDRLEVPELSNIHRETR